MTRALIFIIFSIIAFIFTIKIYASRKMEHLYKILYDCQLRHSYHLCSDVSYLKKYLDVVFFRHSYYIFLSPYLRDTKMEGAHFYVSYLFPNTSKKIDKDYSLDFFK